MGQDEYLYKPPGESILNKKSNIANDLRNREIAKKLKTKANTKVHHRPSVSSASDANEIYSSHFDVCDYEPLGSASIDAELIKALYIKKVGKDYSDIGLKTYIDAIKDAQKFRQRCFYILSKKTRSRCMQPHVEVDQSVDYDDWDEYIPPEPLERRPKMRNLVDFGKFAPPTSIFDTPEKPHIVHAQQNVPIQPSPIFQLVQVPGGGLQLSALGQPITVAAAAPIVANVPVASPIASTAVVGAPPATQQVGSEAPPTSDVSQSNNNANSEGDLMLSRFFKENEKLIPTNCDVEALSYAEKLALLKQLNLENDYIAMKLCSRFNYKTNVPNPTPLAEFSMYGKLDATEIAVDHEALFSDTSLFDKKNASVLGNA